MDKLIFTQDDKSEEFYVLEQTRINGQNYLLVTEKEDGDSVALILKDTSSDDEEEAQYIEVLDEEELASVVGVFSSLLDDVDID